MRAGEDLRVEKPGVRLVGLPGFSVDLGEIIKWNLENIYIFKKKRRNHSDLTRRIGALFVHRCVTWDRNDSFIRCNEKCLRETGPNRYTNKESPREIGRAHV